MEMFLRKLVIVGLVVAAVLGSDIGSSKAQSLCNMSISGLMACQPAVTGPHPAEPQVTCCSALAKANMTCLCTYKSALPTYGIDPKLAMQLPGKCNLTPPTKC